MGVCPFALPETLTYPCLATLYESITSNHIVFSAGRNMSIEANTWLANVDGSEIIYLETFPDFPEDVIWSSNEVQTVDALAVRGDEGRSNLR